jgi:hypothetical protein
LDGRKLHFNNTVGQLFFSSNFFHTHCIYLFEALKACQNKGMCALDFCSNAGNSPLLQVVHRSPRIFQLHKFSNSLSVRKNLFLCNQNHFILTY